MGKFTLNTELIEAPHLKVKTLVQIVVQDMIQVNQESADKRNYQAGF